MPNATHRAVLAYLESSLMAEETRRYAAHAPLQPNTRATSIDRTPDNPYVPLNFNSNALGLDWMDFQDDFDRPDFY
jgi:hypothetical protein